METRAGWVALLLLGSVAIGSAQTPADLPEIPDSARRYYDRLLERPEPGALIGRLCAFWSEETSLEEIATTVARLAESDEGDDAFARATVAALLFEKIGATEQANHWFDEAIRRNPEERAVLLWKARSETGRRNWREALRLLDQLLSGEPAAIPLPPAVLAEAVKLKGRLLIRFGKGREGIAFFEKALATNPDDLDLWADLIETLWEEDRGDAAVEKLQALIEKIGDRDVYGAVQNRLWLSDLHRQRGEKGSTLKVLEEALKRAGRATWVETEILARIESIHREDDDLYGLRSHLERLVKNGENRLAIELALIRLSAESGNLEPALDRFADILKRTPGRRDIRESYIDLLEKEELWERAIAECENLLKQSPDDLPLRERLARIHFENGDKDEAVRAIHRWLAGGELSPQRTLGAAAELEKFGVPDEAESVIRDAIVDADAEAGVELRHALASLLDRTERETEAAEIWKSLAAGGERVQALRFAGELRRRGHAESAYRVLEKRSADRERDLRFLEALAESAEEANLHEEAWNWALIQVEAAESLFDLNNAITRAAQFVGRYDRPARIGQLQSSPPGSPNRRGLIAWLQVLDGKPEDALTTVRSFRTENPAFSWAQEAAILKRNRQWAAAAQATEALLKLPGQEGKTVLYQDAAMLWERAGVFDRALAWIQRWRESSPGNWRVRLREARLLEKAGRPIESLEVLRRAARTFEKETEVLIALASGCAKAGLGADAENVFWRLYAEAKTSPEKLRWVRRLYETASSRGKVAALINEFQRRRDSNRSSVVPLLALATIHREQHDETGRRAALTAASRLEPNEVSLIVELASLEEESGNFDAALRQLERAEEFDETGSITKQIARLTFKTGQTAVAVAKLGKLLASDHLNREEWLGAIEALVIQGEFEHAEVLVNAAQLRFPDDSELLFLLGAIRKANGDWSAAAAAFIEVMALNERNSAIPMVDVQAMLSENANLILAELFKNRAVRFQDIRGRVYALFSPAVSRTGASRIPVAGLGLLGPDVTGDFFLYALANLDDLASRLTEAERAAAAGRAVRAGLPEFRARWFEAGLSATRNTRAEILDRFPNDSVALELALVVDSESTLESDKTALERFRVDRPEIAIIAALRLATRAELTRVDRRHYLQIIKELSQRIDSPTPHHIEKWNGYCGFLLKQKEFPELTTEERRSIAALGVGLYRGWRESGGRSNPRMFCAVAAPLISEGPPGFFEEMVRIELDHATGKFPAGPVSPAVLDRNMVEEQFSVGKWIPEAAVSSFPITILSAAIPKGVEVDPFSAPGNVPAGSLPIIAAGIASLDPDKFDHSIFKFIIAVCRGDEAEVIERRLEEMLADSSAGDDRFLVAIHYYRNINRNETRAVSLLEQILEKPPSSAPARWTLQITAVFLGRATKNTALETRALRALSKEPMNIGALNYFNPLFQAAGIEPNPATPSPPRPLGSGVSPLMNAQRPGTSRLSQWMPSGLAINNQVSHRIVELVKAGRIDAAARWFAVEMRPLALQQLAAGYYQSDQGGFDPFLHGAMRAPAQSPRIAATEGLREAILENLNAHEQQAAGDRDRAIAGSIRELLGDYEGAGRLYSAILAAAPEDDIIRLRKIAVTIRSGGDLDSWLGDIRKLDTAGLASISGLLFNLRSPENTVSDAVKALTELLERAEKDKWIRDELLPKLVKDLGAAQSALMASYQKAAANRNPVDPVLGEATERFHRGLLVLPVMAPEALKFLTAQYEAENRAIPEEFWERCRDILAEESGSIAGFGRGEIRRFRDLIQVRSFPELAAFLAAAHGGEAELRETIRQWRVDELNPAPEYTFFADLHFATPEEFPGRIAANLLPRKDGSPVPEVWAGLLENALLIAREREIDVNFNSVFERLYRAHGPSHDNHLAALRHLRWLAERGRFDEGDTLIQSLFEICLEGAKESERRAVTEPKEKARTEHLRRSAFRLLHEVVSIEEFALTAWDLWDSAPDPPARTRSISVAFLNKPDFFKDPGRVIRVMKRAGILEPAKTFELREIPEDFRGELKMNHWVSLVAIRIRQVPEAIAEIDQRLTADHPDSPGATLVLSMAKHGIDGQDVRDLMAERMDLFEALPETEKPKVARYINNRSYSFRSCPELGQWVWENWSGAFESEIDEFFAKEPEPADYVIFGRFLAETAKHRQHEFGVALLKRWVERHQELVNPGRRASIISDRLGKLASEEKYYPADRSWNWWLDRTESIDMQLAVFQDPDISPFEHEISLSQWVTRLDHQTRRRTPLDPGEKIENLRRLGARFEKHPLRALLIPPASSALFVYTQHINDRRRLVESAKKTEGAGAWLLHEIAVHGEELAGPHVVPREGEPIEWSKYLDDKSVPLGVRLYFANWNFDRAIFPWLLELPAMETVVATWKEALFRDGSPLPDQRADDANRLAIALRVLRGRGRTELDSIDLGDLTAKLKKQLQIKIENEKRELQSITRTGDENDLLSAFWPAYLNLLVAEGNHAECLDLWEWMHRNQVRYRWIRRRSADRLNSESEFLRTVAVLAFREDGPEAADSAIERIGDILRQHEREKIDSTLNLIVNGMMLGLPAADRARLVAKWMIDPPEGIDPGRKWESIRPFSLPSPTQPESIGPRASNEERLLEVVENLAANPIEKRTAPLVLGRLFSEAVSGRTSLREFFASRVSKHEPEEIEASAVLRELAWSTGDRRYLPEPRHIAALSDPGLPLFYRMEACHHFLTVLEKYGMNRGPHPSDSVHKNLAIAGGHILSEALESQDRRILRDPSVATMIRALSVHSGEGPEMARINQKIISMPLEVFDAAGIKILENETWARGILRLIPVDGDQERARKIIETVAAGFRMDDLVFEQWMRRGFFEKAAFHFQENWFDLNPVRWGELRYRQGFEKMPGHISDPEIAFLARLYLAACPGPSEPASETERDIRMLTLAEDFRSVAFKDQRLQDRAIDQLIRYPDALNTIREEFQKELGEYPFSQILTAPSDYGDFRRKWSRWKANFEMMIRHGELAEVAEQIPGGRWFSMVPDPRENRFGRLTGIGSPASLQQQVWVGFFEMFTDPRVLENRANWKALDDALAKLSPIPGGLNRSRVISARAGLPPITSQYGWVSSRAVTDYFGGRLALEVALEKEKAGEWIEKIPGAKTKLSSGQTFAFDTASAYLKTARVLSPGDTGSLEERREIFDRYLSAPMALPIRKESRASLLETSGWLEPGEILGFLAEDAKTPHEKGAAFAELAVQSYRAGNRESAYDYMSQAFELMNPDDPPRNFRGYESLWKRLLDWKKKESNLEKKP